MAGKHYTQELDKFGKMLADRVPFALTLFGGDGEWRVIQDEPICVPGEWSYQPGEQLRERLLAGLRWKHPRHYVGIGCACCTGEVQTRKWWELSGQDEEHVTFANLICNGNYDRYLETWVPLFGRYNCIVAHSNEGTIADLPFKVASALDVKLSTDAWRDAQAVRRLVYYAADTNNRIFLISGGPFSRFMVPLLQQINDRNTYIDIGSTLDPLMGIPPNRGYLKGEATRQKVCRWI
jgi:hypothetical protein